MRPQGRSPATTPEEGKKAAVGVQHVPHLWPQGHRHEEGAQEGAPAEEEAPVRLRPQGRRRGETVPEEGPEAEVAAKPYPWPDHPRPRRPQVLRSQDRRTRRPSRLERTGRRTAAGQPQGSTPTVNRNSAVRDRSTQRETA